MILVIICLLLFIPLVIIAIRKHNRQKLYELTRLYQEIDLELRLLVDYLELEFYEENWQSYYKKLIRKKRKARKGKTRRKKKTKK